MNNLDDRQVVEVVLFTALILAHKPLLLKDAAISLENLNRLAKGGALMVVPEEPNE